MTTERTVVSDTNETELTTIDETIEIDENAETFPREYVEKIRRESAGHRTRASGAEERADALAARLHTALVTATGLLADASDLPFDATHLDDADALATAIDALTTGKPHLKSRKPSGSVGQGVKGAEDVPLTFATMLQNHP
jgi:hypothetical protein